MIKMSTLFKKNPDDLSRVINEINPENEWVFTDGIPTRKYDGTACMILNNELYKRYDARRNKKGIWKKAPEGAIPCCEPDLVTGHHPHWIKCDRNNPEDKYHFEALDRFAFYMEGTYELCGEKINGNHEGFYGHLLIQHGIHKLEISDFSFESIKQFLTINDIEGIVFHERNGKRMCKIRKRDFGLKWGINE